MIFPRHKLFLSLLSAALLTGCGASHDKIAFQHIDAILDQLSTTDIQWSALITDEKGKVCYQKNSDRQFIPASNLKLLTVSGALGVLGTNHSFETRIYLDGQLADGVLNGDINLLSEHDITWNSAVFPSNAAAPLEHIAAQLKAKGLKSVLGNVQCYGACFYNLDPNVRMRDARNQATYNGWAADAFKGALARSGIAVSTNEPLGQAGFTAPGTLFYTHHSTDLRFNGRPLDLQTACIPLLKESEGVMADALLRHVGFKSRAEDSYSAGAPLVYGWLSSVPKINTNDLCILDGSGISQADHCSVSQVLSLVCYMVPHYPLFAAALPISGTDGTLAQRFLGTAAVGKIHAKTGTLRVCVALSGYVAKPGGAPRYFFSIIANTSGDIALTSPRQTIDDAVTELALLQ